MEIINRFGFSVFLCLLLISGCSKPLPQDTSVPFLEFGKGITNRIQIGMTLKDVERNNGDVEVTKVKLPAKLFGFLPWKRTAAYRVKIPSLGAAALIADKTTKLSMIVFEFQPQNTTNYFKGILSGGLVVNDGKHLTRAAIVKALGEPNPIGTNNVFSVLPAANASTEDLTYMQWGVRFGVRTGVVDMILITRPGRSLNWIK